MTLTTLCATASVRCPTYGPQVRTIGLDLPGPSRRIRIDPVRLPDPVQEPLPQSPPPEREVPEPEPAPERVSA